MTWLVGEARRNVVSGTTHALLYATALTVLVGALVAIDVMAVDGILGQAAGYRAADANVTTVESAGHIDGQACEAIRTLPGIEAAGAVRQDQVPLVPAALPNGSIASYTVTPGALDVFRGDGDTGGPGVVLSRDAAGSLGLSPGDVLATTVGSAPVRATFSWPDDGRRHGFSYAALTPSDVSARYDECWVRSWPVPANLAAVMRLTVTEDADESATIVFSQLNTTRGTTFDGARSFAERSTRHAPWISLVGALAIGFVSIRSRRVELASARHVGVGIAHQHTLTLLETAFWLFASTVLVGALVVVLISSGNGQDDAALVGVAARIWLCGVFGAALGSQLAAALNLEKHLFRYFKNR